MHLFCHHKHAPRSMPLQTKRRLRQRLLPVAAMELTATTIVVADVLRAKSFRRGHRLGWLLLAFVQPFGPWLYFAFGQQR
ncbi:PLD nuclease N-terminal domain-containing protein [Lactiplantibacillus paraplantarum]|nr:PLD nuclease N-terminal domain-containing protein [Lactiplantibacillus paraplantarum]WEE35711.1 PLD nuclease N-terminal domain-containing protein [Lactiplantibacillus paraplantarum]